MYIELSPFEDCKTRNRFGEFVIQNSETIPQTIIRSIFKITSVRLTCLGFYKLEFNGTNKEDTFELSFNDRVTAEQAYNECIDLINKNLFYRVKVLAEELGSNQIKLI